MKKSIFSVVLGDNSKVNVDGITQYYSKYEANKKNVMLNGKKVELEAEYVIEESRMITFKLSGLPEIIAQSINDAGKEVIFDSNTWGIERIYAGDIFETLIGDKLIPESSYEEARKLNAICKDYHFVHIKW